MTLPAYVHVERTARGGFLRYPPSLGESAMRTMRCPVLRGGVWQDCHTPPRRRQVVAAPTLGRAGPHERGDRRRTGAAARVLIMLEEDVRIAPRLTGDTPRPLA